MATRNADIFPCHQIYGTLLDTWSYIFGSYTFGNLYVITKRDQVKKKKKEEDKPENIMNVMETVTCSDCPRM